MATAAMAPDADAASVVERATADIRALRAQVASTRALPVLVREQFDKFWEDLKTAEQLAEGEVPGIPYHLHDLNRATGGQAPGELTIVLGSTGGGKSAFVSQSWVAAASRGPSLLAANEMLLRQHVRRLMSTVAHVDTLRMRIPRTLTPDDEQRLSEAMATIAQAGDLYLQEQLFTLSALRAGIETVLERSGRIAWVGLDWMQQLRGPHRRETRALELDDLGTELQAIAIEYEVPIMVAAQLNVASAMSGAIGAEGVRGRGGSIFPASTVIQIQFERPLKENESPPPDRPAKLFLPKNRSGAPTSTSVLFRGRFLEFVQRDVRREEIEL
jgi:replicative DNA helicase